MSRYNLKHFDAIEAAKRAHMSIGGHFFDSATMKAFNSKICHGKWTNSKRFLFLVERWGGGRTPQPMQFRVLLVDMRKTKEMYGCVQRMSSGGVPTYWPYKSPGRSGIEEGQRLECMNFPRRAQAELYMNECAKKFERSMKEKGAIL